MSISSGSRRPTLANAGDLAKRTQVMPVRGTAPAVRDVGRAGPGIVGRESMRESPAAGFPQNRLQWVDVWLPHCPGNAMPTCTRPAWRGR